MKLIMKRWGELFGVNKKEPPPSLEDIICRYSTYDVADAVLLLKPDALGAMIASTPDNALRVIIKNNKPGFHYSRNPSKKEKVTP